MEHRTAWQQDTAFRPSIKTIRLFVSYQGLIGAMPHVRCVRRRDNKKKEKKLGAAAPSFRLQILNPRHACPFMLWDECSFTFRAACFGWRETERSWYRTELALCSLESAGCVSDLKGDWCNQCNLLLCLRPRGVQILFGVSPRYWYWILSWSKKGIALAGQDGFLLYCGKVSMLLIDGEVSIGITWPYQSVHSLFVALNTPHPIAMSPCLAFIHRPG